jgi:hypothetical protein
MPAEHNVAEDLMRLSFLRRAAEDTRQMISRSLAVIRETETILQEIERQYRPLVDRR